MVLFSGLASRADLNGKSGRFISQDAPDGRCAVTVVDTGELIGVRPGNLRKSIVGPCAAPTTQTTTKMA